MGNNKINRESHKYAKDLGDTREEVRKLNEELQQKKTQITALEDALLVNAKNQRR